jgi:hypothetical protein
MNDRIVLRYIKGNLWEVEKEIPIDRNTSVPIGFKTDLASLPRFLWAVFPPYGKYLRAAIIHDFLLSDYRVNPEIAHNIFHKIMLEDGVNPLTAFFFYQFVKLCLYDCH